MDHRKHRKFIASSAVISFVSFVLMCISICSDDWIRARGSVVNITNDDYIHSTIHYGLFKGTLVRSILASPMIYNIYFTCVWELNSCAWSCLNDRDSRLEEIKALINGEESSFKCQPLITYKTLKNYHHNDRNGNGSINDMKFLNAAMNLSTVLLIVVTITSLLICAVLGVLNYKKCPRTEILSLSGIILSSTCAFVANCVGLVVYGCYFNYWLKENIGIYDTIVGEYQSHAHLGSGYWLSMAGCILNPISILLLYIRNILLRRKERGETIVIVSRVNDPTTVLY